MRRILMRSRQPPGPRSWIPGRHLLAFRRDPLAFLERVAHEYGDICHFRFGPRKLYLLNRPDLVKDVLITRNRNFIKSPALRRTRMLLGNGLLTSEGAFHLRQRRLVQPAFHRRRVDAYAATMVDYAIRAADRLRDGARVDVARAMNGLTLAVVGKTLFDAELEDEASDIGRALTDAMLLFGRASVPLSEWLDRLPLPATLRFRRARAHLDATIHGMIEARRRAGVDRGDLLSMLLLARDEDGDGGGMTDEQVRDEALTLFLAGHETTANALTWTWYLLSRHPEAEARLHAEVDRVLGVRPPRAADLEALPYTRQVVAEAMRLYPPAWVIGREAVDAFDVDGRRIPAGGIVLLSPWVLHRDARWFPDPLRFDPGRWTPEAEAERPRLAYVPFGAGPRKCIGEGFAWMEARLVLATWAQRWRLRLVPGHPVATQPLITLRARHGMRMTVHRRLDR